MPASYMALGGTAGSAQEWQPRHTQDAQLLLVPEPVLTEEQWIF